MSITVKANWWAAILQPVVLAVGAAFAALNIDVDPLLDSMSNKYFFKKSKFFEEYDSIHH